MSEEQFKKKELDRYFILKRLGWKQLLIKSPKDYLPSSEVITNIINSNKEELKNIKCKISHIVIDIGNNKNHPLYGKLTKNTSTENIN